MKKRLIHLLLFYSILNASLSYAQIFTQITTHSSRDYSPAWSPDGSHIAFTSHRSGVGQIYIYSLIDSSITKLALQGSENWVSLLPAWSKNGEKIAFEMSVNYSTCPEIYTVNSSGGVPKKLTQMNGFPLGLSWSPDGSQIVFGWISDLVGVGISLLYTVPSSGGSSTRLFLTSEFNEDPCWSPDGKKIAFWHGKPHYYPTWDPCHIYAYDITTGYADQITFGDSDDHGPDYSSDGQWIAFSRWTYEDPTDPECNIFIVPSGAGDVIKLTRFLREGEYYYNYDPSWSPDGKSIVFTSRVADDWFDQDIWIITDFTTHIESEKNQIISPTEFKLEQNFPNPFNPTTIISYALPKPCNISLKIYNFIGQEITTLVSQIQPAGEYEVQWNASNLPSGVYVCRFQAGEFVQTRKLLLLR